MHVSVVVSGMCVMCSVNGMLCSVNGMFIGVQGGLSGGLDQSAWRCFSLFFFLAIFSVVSGRLCVCVQSHLE